MEPMAILTLITATAALLHSAFHAQPDQQIHITLTAPPKPERAGVGCMTIVVVFVGLLVAVRMLAG